MTPELIPISSPSQKTLTIELGDSKMMISFSKCFSSKKPPVQLQQSLET
jgi:hypothetical protein